MERTGPTLYMQYRSVPSQMSLSSSGLPGRLSSWCMNWAKAFIRLELPPTHTNWKQEAEKMISRFSRLSEAFNLCYSAFCIPWCLQTFVAGRESWCSGWNGRGCPPPWCPSRDFSLEHVACKWKRHRILLKKKGRRQMVQPIYKQSLNKRSCLTPKLP